MKIIHRYILREALRNTILCSVGLTALFLIFEFFDRIDNIARESVGIGLTLKYFSYKIPIVFNTTLPIAMLVGTLFTIGLLAKNSEITAMRAAGLKVLWLARPVLIMAFVLSGLSLLLSETIVPDAARRAREVYNIDIREKDKSGGYSRSHFWWREGPHFFSVDMFDSRSNELLNLSRFNIDENFEVRERIEAARALWLNQRFGWSLYNVRQQYFQEGAVPVTQEDPSRPLSISKEPQDFYTAKTDPETMSFKELRRFITEQQANGIAVRGYYADLYAKIAFPLVVFFSTLVVLPFALKPARSGSMAASFVAAVVIAFSYFAVHSFSLALGRAELWHPLVAAWTANIIMGCVGLVLNVGGEAPS